MTKPSTPLSLALARRLAGLTTTSSSASFSNSPCQSLATAARISRLHRHCKFLPPRPRPTASTSQPHDAAKVWSEARRPQPSRFLPSSEDALPPEAETEFVARSLLDFERTASLAGNGAGLVL